ncbi:MAG: glycosyltransferase family A protein, partial [Anaerolineae bacterium]
ATAPRPGRPSRAGLPRCAFAIDLDDLMKLSIVLIAYDMQREVPRTLQSLLPCYQRGGDELPYEVILIDNGSPQPLQVDPAALPGLNLRQLRIEDGSPSPAQAINRGIAMARGEVVCVMVDGAHLLTPGTLQWAMRCFAAFDNPVVATRYFYLGPMEQPEAIQRGYTKGVEDELLAQIQWPDDGYRLFEIGTPLRHGADKITWFNRMFESNCLFLRKSLLEAVGGADERFDLPGGGFVNLDLYKRAADTPGANLVQLVGEGSFHQLHGGTTTNSGKDEREARLEAFRDQYQSLRGDLQLVSGKPLNFMGHLPTQASKIHLRNRAP